MRMLYEINLEKLQTDVSALGESLDKLIKTIVDSIKPDRLEYVEICLSEFLIRYASKNLDQV